jgi:tetratricopeptide (TPR) repeat protein
MNKSASTPNDYKHFVRRAKARITAWRRQHSIVWAEVETDGLKRATIARIFATEKDRSLEDWLIKLAALFTRLNAVCIGKKVQANHRSWEDIFGHDFPKPPVAPDFSVSNYADVAIGKVRKLSTPLIEFFDTEFRSANDQKNIWKASQFLVHLCELYELTADWQRAADSFAMLAEINKKTGDFHHVADSLLRRGLALFYAGLAKEAETQFQNGLDVIAEHSSKTPPFRTELRLWNYLALAKNELGDSEGARRLLETRSLHLAKNRSSQAAVASVHNRLGIVCLRLGDLPAAADNLIQALEIRVKLSMRSEAVRTLFVLGNVHESKGELPQAILIWQITVALQRALRDYESIAKTSFELGRTYILLHDNPVLEKEASLSVSLTPASFVNDLELRTIQQMQKTTDAPDRFIVNKSALLRMARYELETAIHWDTETDDNRIVELANRELGALKSRLEERKNSESKKR